MRLGLTLKDDSEVQERIRLMRRARLKKSKLLGKPPDAVSCPEELDERDKACEDPAVAELPARPLTVFLAARKVADADGYVLLADIAEETGFTPGSVNAHVHVLRVLGMWPFNIARKLKKSG